jgi:hypothetical protein
MYRQGRIYLRVILAVAVLAIAIYSLTALAANPFASPAIVTDTNFSN